MRKHYTRTPHFGIKLRRNVLSVAIFSASQVIWAPSALAGPDGGRVIDGGGSIERDGRNTTINQHTDRMVIDWDSYNVGADQVVTYIQPGTDSISLNRILSNNGSQIHGQINANGHVVLVNPHGIVFGENAQVNVGGLIASGMRVDTSDFMNGDFTFSAVEGAEGKVVNQGLINAATGGSVTLLGKQVRNDGLISARLGAVSLAAGKEAVVTFDDSGLMGVRVSKEILQDELGVDAAIVNTGEIKAQGGRILLTASTSRDIFSKAVNTGDLRQATSAVVHEDGSFTLGSGADVLNTGSLNVSSSDRGAGDVVVLGENVTQAGSILANTSSGTSGAIELHAGHTALLTEDSVTSARAEGRGLGGRVKVLGHHVGLFDRATVDVSGAWGGGQVYVGGDYQGENPFLRNAWRTYVGDEAHIKANALADGDGGRIIVWADDITRYFGQIEGQGAGTGKGGFAEVSGKNQLRFDGLANMQGPGGVGTLLLDPRDIWISGLGEEDPVDQTVSFEEGDGQDFTIRPQTLMDNLRTADVKLEATRNITVSQGGDITAVGAHSLSFLAGKNIGIEADISLGEGNLYLTAGVASCGDVACYEPDVNEDPTRSVTINRRLNTQGSIIVEAADNIVLSREIGNELQPSDVTFRAGNDITVQGNGEINVIGTSGTTGISLTAGDTTLVSEGITTTSLDGGDGKLILSGPLNSNGSHISLEAQGIVNISSGVNTGGGNLLVGTEQNRVGSFTSQNTVLSTSSQDEVGGDISIYTVGNAQLGGATFGGTNADSEADIGELTVNAVDGDITLTGDYEYNSSKEGARGNLNLNAQNGGITLSGVDIDNGPAPDISILDITLNARSNIMLDDNSILWLTGGAFNATSDEGNITLDHGAFGTQGGDITLSSPRGTISVNSNLNMEGGSIIVTDADAFTNEAYFETAGRVDVNASNAVDLGQLSAISLTVNAGGNVTTSERLHVSGTTDITGNDINLGHGNNHFAEAISLNASGNVLLQNSQSTTLSTTDIDGNFVLTTVGSISDAGDIVVGGETTFNVSGDGITGLTDHNHDFIGKVNIGSARSVAIQDIARLEVGDISVTNDDEQAGTVSLTAETNLVVGSVTANGGENRSGGSISLIAGADLEAGALTANAGNRPGGNHGKSGGTITLQSGESHTITLNDHVSARGARGSSGGSFSDGAGGTIALTGNVALADTLRLDTRALNNRHNGGSVTLTGTLNSAAVPVVEGEDNHLHSLAIYTSQAIITGDVGVGEGIHNLTITAGDGGSLVQAGTTYNNGLIQLGGDIATEGEITLSLPGDEAGTIELNHNRALSSDVTLNAHNADNHRFYVPDAAGVWATSANYSGSVTQTQDNNESTLTFSGFRHLQGSDQGDTFNLSHRFATVTGGAGADHFQLSEGARITTLRGNPESGASEGNQLSVLSDSNDTVTWSVTGQGAGNVANWVDNFYDIANLTGGAGEDRFDFIGDGMASVDGGGGSGNAVDLTESLGSFRLGMGAAVEADINLINIQHLYANSEDGHTLAGANENNTWTIDDENAGNLNGDLSFEGITHLLGNGADDTFVLEGGGSVSIIDGHSGDNTLDLTEVSEERQVRVALADRDGDNVTVQNVQTLTADAEAQHTLLGAHQNTTWTITGTNTGSVEGVEFERPVEFKGFAYLIGGDADDTFIHESAGEITGQINGGGHETRNSLDYSNVSEVDITWGEGWDFVQIQHLRGNGRNSILRGGDNDHIWTVDGENRGSLASGSDSLDFSGMTQLVGGSQADTFNVNGGWITDGIVGGAGRSVLNLTLAEGSAGQLHFDGGGSNDNEITVSGQGGENVRYSISNDGQESLVYTTRSGSNYRLDFSDVAEVDDQWSADTLTIQGSVQADDMYLNGNRFHIDGYTGLIINHKNNLNIAGSTQDRLALAGDLNITGRVEIRNAAVRQAGEGRLTAESLRLDGVSEFGSASQPILTSVQNIDVRVGRTDLYLNDQGRLNITALSGSGVVDWQVEGELSSSQALTASGPVSLVSHHGGIALNHDNRLTGPLSLSAAGGVTLNNVNDTYLGDITAQTLDLRVNGDLTGEGRLAVSGLTTLSVDGDVRLEQDNRLTSLEIHEVEDVVINNAQALELAGLTTGGKADIQAEGLHLTGPVVADQLSLNAGGGEARLDRRVTVQGDLDVQAHGLRLNGAVSAGTARLHSSADLMLNAALKAENGTVFLTADAGAIGGGSGASISANRLEMSAQNGIGGEAVLNTNVDSLHAQSQTGRIWLYNTGDLHVERLATNGAIRLSNTGGSVTLDNRNGPVFSTTETDALKAGGTANANYDLGSLSIDVENGGLLALGQADVNNPDIVARNANLIAQGDIGAPGRPLVIYVRDSLFIQGWRSWPTAWGFGRRPNQVEDSSSIQLNFIDLLKAGSEQMVELESLEDIDPAIFTEVRNYSYHDIAIKLPPDQQHDEDYW